MSKLTEERFDSLCGIAERILRQCGPGAPAPDDMVRPDYGMYRLGDDRFLAVGLIWHDSEGRFRSAKIQDGIVTDHYVILGEDGPYRSAQIDPVTYEYIAMYKSDPKGTEPKLDPETGKLLQQNFYTAYHPLPQHYIDELEKVNFPFMDSIFCWADKPYGSCVEFGANMRKRVNPDNWYHLPYKLGNVNGVSIRKFNSGYGLFAAAAGHSGRWIDDLWMCTDWQAIAELLCQIELAKGRVLVTGLGLGLVALLVANKTDVDEVIVLENDKSVLELFYMQGFDLTKIKIVEADALTYTDTRFDTILLDHYNYIGEEPIIGVKHASEVIRQNTNSMGADVIPYRWTEFLRDYGSSSIRWGEALGIPKITVQQELRYADAFNKARDAISYLCDSLKQINSKRK